MVTHLQVAFPGGVVVACSGIKAANQDYLDVLLAFTTGISTTTTVASDVTCLGCRDMKVWAYALQGEAIAARRTLTVFAAQALFMNTEAQIAYSKAIRECAGRLSARDA